MIEATYKNDLEHGLYREITRNFTIVKLFKDGEEMGSFQFNKTNSNIDILNNNQTLLLNDLIPNHFYS